MVQDINFQRATGAHVAQFRYQRTPKQSIDGPFNLSSLDGLKLGQLECAHPYRVNATPSARYV